MGLAADTRDGDVYRELGIRRAGETARIEVPYPIEIDVASRLPEA